MFVSRPGVPAYSSCLPPHGHMCRVGNAFPGPGNATRQPRGPQTAGRTRERAPRPVIESIVKAGRSRSLFLNVEVSFHSGIQNVTRAHVLMLHTPQLRFYAASHRNGRPDKMHVLCTTLRPSSPRISYCPPQRLGAPRHRSSFRHQTLCSSNGRSE